MEWMYLPLQWYGFLFLLGIVFFPLTKKLFGKFPDNGYAFSKILSILFLSYSVFILGIFKILPFTRLTLFVVICFLAGINALIFKKNGQKDRSNPHEDKKTIPLIVI